MLWKSEAYSLKSGIKLYFPGHPVGVKFTPEEATKAQKVSRGIVLIFL
jgi:hypothetical protein